MSDEKTRDGAIKKTIDDFTGGYNLYNDPSKIRENEFQVFENIVINKPGRYLNANKRGSIEPWNIINSANTGEDINSMFEIIWKKKAFTNRILVKTKSSLEYVEDETNTFNTIIDSIPESKMKAIMYNDNVYIANNNNGDDVNTIYTGTDYLNIGCPPCYQGFTAALSAQSATAIGTGVYKYLIAFLYDDIMESGVVLMSGNDTEIRNFVVTVGTQLNVFLLDAVLIDNSTGKKINLTGIPTGNVRVTGRVVYRTKSDGDVFYYLTTIKDNVTTILLNDDTPDDELTDEYNGGDGFKNILKPYKSKYHVIHQRRLWQANLQENQYEAPDVTGIGVSGTGIVNGNISTDAARAAIYSYKIANDIRVIKGKSFTGTDKTIKPPYTGILGAMSAAKRTTLHATDTEVSLTLIPIDQFCQRTAILRNCCQFISGIAVAGTVLTITVGAANVFKEGETVTISGVAGFTANPNGTYVINTVTATTFKITATTTGGTYTASSGVVEGSNFYICGFSKTGSFIDGYSDTYLTGLGVTINTATENNKYKSGVISSEIDEPDIFPPGNFIDLGRDNGEEIMGIFSDERRLIVFKENSIYEIDTTYQDTVYARARKIVSNIGAKYATGIVEVDTGEYIFLANDNYIYHWNGRGKPRQISMKIQSIIQDITYVNFDGVYYPKNKWVVLTYSTASGIAGNALVYDMNVADSNGNGTWYHFTMNTIDLNLCAPLITKEGSLLFGNRLAGYIMKYSNSNEDNLIISSTAYNSQSIIMKVETKKFRDLQTIKKVFARISVQGGGTNNVFIFWGITSESFKEFSLVSGLNIMENKINITGREFYMRIEITNSSNISIKEMGFEYLTEHKASAI